MMFRQPQDVIVQPGESLFRIARRFQTTPEAIVQYNKLDSMSLNVGQRLRIPAYTEAVVNADSVTVRLGAGTGSPVIAQMDKGARLPVLGGDQQWLRVRLYNGKRGWVARRSVTLAVYNGSRPVQEVLGFYTEQEGPTLPSSYEDFVQHVSEIAEIGFFHFRIDRELPTNVEKFYSFTDEYLRNVVNFGHRHNILMVPIVHNLLYERGNQEVNKQVLREMLKTSTTRSEFIQSIFRTIETYNFDGVHIDFEDIYYEDRFLLSDFYRELGEALKSRGLYYVVSTPARTSDRPTNPFSAAFDYALLGQVVDELSIMLYNEHGWPGSGPGPVVSIGWMEKVLRYALTKMRAAKITAAVSVFGFDFNLTTKKNTYVTYNMALNIARKYNQQVNFDQPTQTPMFSYQDEQGNQHEVWFENADSIRGKLLLANRLGTRGVALWRLGMEDPAIWPMIQSEFTVSLEAGRRPPIRF